MMGGGESTSNTVSEFKPPEYTREPWQNLVANATQLAGQGMPIYTGQTVAPLSQQSQAGIGQLTSLATQGSPLYNAGQTNLTGTLQGDFMNPYATAANPYIGNNPYLQQMIEQSNQGITDAFSRGTAAQTDRAAAMAHAFGGSGQLEAQQANAGTLGRILAQNTSGLLGQNYYNSANLAEQGLNRAGGAVESERARQLQAAGMAPGYQSADINAIQAMMGGGDAVQNYQQQLLNAASGLFSQFQQAPWMLSDLLGSALSRASGGQGTTSSQIVQPGVSPWQALAGAGAGAYGMFGGP
jgi:hypothetical protein